METILTPELVSGLVGGECIALVRRSLSGPPSTAGATNVVLQSSNCGDTLYDLVLVKSAGSVPAMDLTGLTLEDPLEVLLHVATVFAFLHTIDQTRPLVHGNLNIDAISADTVTGAIVISGFEHCRIQPGDSTSGVTVSPEQPVKPQDWPCSDGHGPSMAPELIHSGMRTTKTDVYAFGMLMFRLYAGEYPLMEVKSRYGSSVSAVARLGNGIRPARESIGHQHFSGGLWALMNECWAQDPFARPTMANVRARLARIVQDRAC